MSRAAKSWMGLLGGVLHVRVPSRIPGRVYFFQSSSMNLKFIVIHALSVLLGAGNASICCYKRHASTIGAHHLCAQTMRAQTIAANYCQD
jgi:hypothetical protein